MLGRTPATSGLLQAEAARWRCDPPAIDAVRLLRIHKYTDPGKVRPMIREAAVKAVSDAAAVSEPSACYVVTPILSTQNNQLLLEGGIRFTGPDFEQHLRGCTHLLAFVMTLGPALDQRSLSLVQDVFEPLDALFLETAGWLTIEAATRALAGELKTTAAREHLRLSMRMGPGYEYRSADRDQRIRWGLEQQEQLFQLFKGQPLPVDLMLPSCAMQPKMSRSGVFGLSPAE